MASLMSSTSLIPSTSSSSSSSKIFNAAIHVPKLPGLRFPIKKTPTRKLPDHDQEILINSKNRSTNNTLVLPQLDQTNIYTSITNSTAVIAQLNLLLEMVSDRIETHNNIAIQRDNWNTLLLNSINMITLTGTTMAGLAAATAEPLFALKLSSTLLFSAATGMLLIMNKIQPSQLAEEQRNATRLFKQLQTQIQTMLITTTTTNPHGLTQKDVKEVMERILALDKAYPLPLLGAMLEKFPATYEPAKWWPNNSTTGTINEPILKRSRSMNGWSEELEEEMREIIDVIKKKDIEDYTRLGNIVLKVNKMLAISGPLLTGMAALSSGFMGNGSSWGAIIALACGSLASAVNALEHGCQVGMVFEMYRNCGGFFKQMEDSVEATLGERDLEKRDNGELFEMKVALKLGRSLSQLRQLARKSASSRRDGIPVDEFASKLF